MLIRRTHFFAVAGVGRWHTTEH